MRLNLPFSLRLTLWYSFILLLALGLFGTLSYWFIARQLYNEQFDELSEDAEQISEVFRLQHGNLDLSYLQEESEELNLNENGVFFEIWNGSQQRIYRSRNFPLDLPTPPPSERQFSHFKLKDPNGLVFHLQTSPVYLYRKADAQKISFFIRMGQSTRYVEKVLRKIRNLLYWLIPLVLGIAGFGGWYLARHAIKPVADITSTARDISLFHLDRRLPALQQDDELGQLVQTFNEMIDRIQAGVQKIQRFTADASHELRTPLTILRGEIEVALRKPRKSEDYQEVLHSGLQELHWMEKIVNDLLLLSRVDAGELRLHKKIISMNALLQELVEQQKRKSEENGITLAVDLPPAPVQCMVDPDRIRQVVLNILDNALKFTPPGGTVTLQLSPTDQSVLLQCRDTGIGIPEKDLPFVFDRFYRVDKARSREHHGSGLGLAISKWLVEAHQGTIEIQSHTGRGTTVNIFLPID